MAITQIDIDEGALAEVMRISGHRTKKGAVNWALREIEERERRHAAFVRAQENAKDWDYEGWKELREREKRELRG